ncbi:hypothetical protein COCCADRAFT_86471 [Bipolaris zeicola 26-R-13]|uniref:Uncharacterized protein n=1 Tax=Cochliobolus carbonum (strain 26-R-13) TaxID=930089 RepID=W6Z0H2_COCC2|nr:uncharacterized protein COCCADRAFT_86471 [Bipolaris zeicola 26-R-13]EUC37181.1 hypothetical protein COCCADRAFT_86471 [Bipolaris zeicola 26-R-13]
MTLRWRRLWGEGKEKRGLWDSGREHAADWTVLDEGPRGFVHGMCIKHVERSHLCKAIRWNGAAKAGPLDNGHGPCGCVIKRIV